MRHSTPRIFFLRLQKPRCLSAFISDNSRNEPVRLEGYGRVGLWDGIAPELLNEDSKENITHNTSRFVYLCPERFQQSVGNLTQQNIAKQSGKTED